jgi:hypothetical protein
LHCWAALATLAVASARIKMVYQMFLMEPSLIFWRASGFPEGEKGNGQGILPEMLCFKIASKFQLSITPNTLKIAFKNDEPSPQNAFFGKGKFS